MHIYICTFIYICKNIYMICISIHTHICVCVRVYISVYICIHIRLPYMSIHTNICVSVRVYISVYICIHIRLPICIYQYTYTITVPHPRPPARESCRHRCPAFRGSSEHTLRALFVLCALAVEHISQPMH